MKLGFIIISIVYIYLVSLLEHGHHELLEVRVALVAHLGLALAGAVLADRRHWRDLHSLGHTHTQACHRKNLAQLFSRVTRAVCRFVMFVSNPSLIFFFVFNFEMWAVRDETKIMSCLSLVFLLSLLFRYLVRLVVKVLDSLSPRIRLFFCLL